MNGYIKLFRKLLDWEWYTDGNVLRLFIHLLLKANFKDKRWKGIEIKRGQLIIGVESFGKEIGLTRQQTKTALSKLESTQEITIKSTNKYTLVTIVKFEVYQCKDSADNQQSNQQITNKYTSNNHQITTTKEGKERKKVKKDKNNTYVDSNEPRTSKLKRFVKPTIEQCQDYCKEKGWKVAFADHFFDGNEQGDWKLSNGQKMKDWKAAMRTWMRKDYNSKFILPKQTEIKPTSNELIIDQIEPSKQKKYINWVSSAVERYTRHKDVTNRQRSEYSYISGMTLIEQFKKDHPNLFEECLAQHHQKIIDNL